MLGLCTCTSGMVPTLFKQFAELAPKLQAKKGRIKGKYCCGFIHYSKLFVVYSFSKILAPGS